mmetsp:Transcript_12698/g.35842  ORF Transcript_12698/g.35842 Transcript_12698/m.35842 type:complete len:386 (-) Transcript_12698:735-1892(-)
MRNVHCPLTKVLVPSIVVPTPDTGLDPFRKLASVLVSVESGHPVPIGKAVLPPPLEFGAVRKLVCTEAFHKVHFDAALDNVDEPGVQIKLLKMILGVLDLSLHLVLPVAGKVVVQRLGEVIDPARRLAHLLLLIELESEQEARDVHVKLVGAAVLGEPDQVKRDLLSVLHRIGGLVQFALGGVEKQVVEEDEVHLLRLRRVRLLVDLRGLPHALARHGDDGVADELAVRLQQASQPRRLRRDLRQLAHLGRLPHAVVDLVGNVLRLLKGGLQVNLVDMIIRGVLVEVLDEEVVARNTLHRHDEKVLQVHTGLGLLLLAHLREAIVLLLLHVVVLQPRLVHVRVLGVDDQHRCHPRKDIANLHRRVVPHRQPLVQLLEQTPVQCRD